jgi:hypothetical protein
MKMLLFSCLAALCMTRVSAGERTFVSLRDFHDAELKYAGIEITTSMNFHVKAMGAGGENGWGNKSDQMYAYGWIINADTRSLVWEMTTRNSSKSGDNRWFDGTVELQPGNYEVYFTAYAFSYHTALNNMNVNVDHRSKPLFGRSDKKKNFFSWFSDWWSDDISKEWDKRSPEWYLEMLADDSYSGSVREFTPPKDPPGVMYKATGLGDQAFVRDAFELSEPITLNIYALGEGKGGSELVDGGWIVNAANRERVWDMERNSEYAGGASKNVKSSADLTLPKGEYVVYYFTDDSHSLADWNDAPPFDPLNWGITLSVRKEQERKFFKRVPYNEYQNVIVAITKVGDNESRSEGFTLKQDANVRVLAFGERSNNRRVMADYGSILDARTRNKVWSMDVDRTQHAGGALKNRYIDEVIRLPRGSYVVTYNTDDSHSYEDWNDDGPFDPEHYGITVMGVGNKFNASIVAPYVEERDKNIIAQIVRPGDDVDKSEPFKLDKTTRVRIYAIGEGQNREMYDYGWIEDARTGNVVWEMSYSMTFHAGGGRKNRMVKTTIMLDKGEYRLRFKSDDSHSYGDWNVDPPEDPQYWGITLYRDEGQAIPPSPPMAPGLPPTPPPRSEKD